MSTMGGFLAGSIIGKLLLDKSGWEAKIKEASKDAEGLAKDILTHSKTIAGIGTAMTVVGGAITGVLGAMIMNTQKAGEEINNLSVKTGVGAEILSGYKLAAEQSETSLQGLAMGFKFLGRNMETAGEGGKKTGGAFKELGVDVRETENGALRPMNDVLLDLADKFSKMEDGPQKSALAMKVFGRAGADLIPFLNLGREGLQANWKEAEKLGKIFSQDAARAADEFGDSLIALKAGLGATGKEIANQLMPTLTSIVQAMTSGVAKIATWVTSHGELVKIIALSVGGFGALLAVLGPILFMLPNIVMGIGMVTTALGVSIGALSGAVVVIGLAIGAVAKLLITLHEVSVAEDYAAEAATRLKDAEAQLSDKLYMLVENGTLLKEDLDDLTKKYHGNIAAMAMAIKHGQEGIPLQKALAEVGKEHSKVLEENSKKQTQATAAAMGWADFLKSKSIPTVAEANTRIAELNGIIAGLGQQLAAHNISWENYQKAVKAAKDEINSILGVSTAWDDFLKSQGINTITNTAAEIDNLKIILAGLKGAYDSGKIGVEDYNKASDAAKLKLGLLNGTIMPLTANQRNLNGVLEAAPDKLEEVGFYTDDLDGAMQKLSDDTGLSIATFKMLAYESVRLAMALQGINLPDLKVPLEPVKENAKAANDIWSGVFSDLSQKFGDTFQSFVKTWSWDKIVNGNINFKKFFSDLWGNVKDSFFRLIGDMAAKWTMSLLTDMISPTKEVGKALTENIGGAMTGVGSTVASVATSLGTVITTLASAVGTGIVTIAEAIGTVIVSLATAIAEAATVLAAAIVPLITIGIFAVALYAAFKLVGGLVDSLLGGGSDNSDMTYWLKMIKDLDQEMHDMFRDLIGIMVYEQEQGDSKWWFMVEQINLAKEANGLLGGIITAIGLAAKDIAAAAGGPATLVPAAAAGAVVMSPSLVWAGERPEAIIPLDQLSTIAARSGMAGAGTASAAAAADLYGGKETGGGGINVTATFNIETVDGSGVRDIVRDKIGPELISWLKTNFGKDQLRWALGL